MTNGFKNSILKKTQLSNSELDQFYALFKPISLNKRDYLLQEGKICRHYYFLSEGLTRTFHVNNKGKEIITAFAIEQWWLTDLESFLSQQPSRLNIQALEPTTALAISHDDLEKAYQDIPKINTFFRKLSQNWLIALERRHNFYMNESGKDRYDFIVQALPDFIQRIPQHMLASYLGLTPEYLSELRKK